MDKLGSGPSSKQGADEEKTRGRLGGGLESGPKGGPRANEAN